MLVLLSSLPLLPRGLDHSIEADRERVESAFGEELVNGSSSSEDNTDDLERFLLGLLSFLPGLLIFGLWPLGFRIKLLCREDSLDGNDLELPLPGPLIFGLRTLGFRITFERLCRGDSLDGNDLELRLLDFRITFKRLRREDSSDDRVR